MSEHTATLTWSRDGALFTDGKFSRKHTWRFDGGAEIVGSPAPQVVPPPMSVPAGVDPEEAFVASLASCHMLFFLALAAKKRFVVDSYVDEAVGALGKRADGKTWMARVTLRPKALFSGDKQPTFEDIAALHTQAHDLCYIANSVTTEVILEPR
ncbi:MAG: OsmC family protein [Hyphomicrobiaceae bacterium]